MRLYKILTTRPAQSDSTLPPLWRKPSSSNLQHRAAIADSPHCEQSHSVCFEAGRPPMTSLRTLPAPVTKDTARARTARSCRYSSARAHRGHPPALMQLPLSGSTHRSWPRSMRWRPDEQEGSTGCRDTKRRCQPKAKGITAPERGSIELQPIGRRWLAFWPEDSVRRSNRGQAPIGRETDGAR